MTISFELSQSVTRLSDQHKALSKSVAALAETIARRSCDTAPVLALLREIQEAAARHFADEERFMESLNYPWLPTHRMNHRWFARFVADYIDGVASGIIAINDDARRNLPTLLKFHLTARDDDFETWLEAARGGTFWFPWARAALSPAHPTTSAG